jgi:streptogramin lyase
VIEARAAYTKPIDNDTNSSDIVDVGENNKDKYSFAEPTRPVAMGETSPIRTITLPSGTPTPFRLVEALGYIWFSTECQQYIIRVDPVEVFMNVTKATKVSEKIAPDHDPNTGGGIFSWYISGITYANGFLWAVANYYGPTGATGCLVKFDPISFNAMQFFEPSIIGTPPYLHGYGEFTNVIFDGDDTLYVTSRGYLKLLKFSISQQAWLTDEYLDMNHTVYDAMLINSTIYFTGNVPGIGYINIESGEKGLYTAPTAQDSVFMTRDKNGEIWFTSNINHSVNHLLWNGTIIEFDLGIIEVPEEPPPDSPYGLAFDDVGNLWIAGYSTRVILNMKVSSDLSVVSDPSDYPVSNQPFYMIKDRSGNIWCWGLASVDLNYISQASGNSSGFSGGGMPLMK